MTTVTSDTRAQAEVRAVLDAWVDATQRVDVDSVLSLYEPNVRAFDAIGPLQFQGVDVYGKHWRDCMSQVHGEMVFQPEQLVIDAEGDLGLAHFLVRCGCEDSHGELQTGWMRGTVAMRKGANGWRIYHEHYSSPFDPETMKVPATLEP